MSDIDQQIIDEFRTNEGQVGGHLEGASQEPWPQFAEYEERTDRTIPVVILEPR